jgi:multidrug resistance protein, MATE family
MHLTLALHFRETVCFIVGSFGIVPLCVHTIAYNLVPLLFMIPLGLSIGLTVRMGHVLAHNVTHAKLMAGWCMGLTMVAAASVSLALYRFRLQVASIFTNDVEVLQGCEDIWPKLCYYIFVIYIFGINSAILRALGLQWRLAVIVFGCLWFCTLPTIIYIAIFRGRGIDGVWSTLPITYTLMQLLLALAYLRADWKLISIDIQNQRANEKPLVEVDPAQELVSSEKTSLLRSMSTKN